MKRAYDFPDSDQLGDEVWCRECGKRTTVAAYDSGIGHYDAAGATGYDSDPYAGTFCCGEGWETDKQREERLAEDEGEAEESEPESAPAEERPL